MRARLVVLLLALATCTKAPPPVLGIWEYRQRNAAAPSGFDSEGERLELGLQGDSVVGVYFGLEREGEEGLFYTVTEVADLSVDRKGKISFVVPARAIFTDRPASLAEAQAEARQSAGFTRDALRMEGELRGGTLVLACSSSPGSCPDRELVFRKGAWQ